MFDLIEPLPEAYLNVELDSNGVILHFDTNIDCFKTNNENLIGINWFNKFISPIDRDKVTQIYNAIFASNIESDLVFSYDIFIFEGKHLYMSFAHRIKLNSEAPVLSLMGHEYHLNKDFIDPYLHCSNVIENFYYLD